MLVDHQGVCPSATMPMDIALGASAALATFSSEAISFARSAFWIIAVPSSVTLSTSGKDDAGNVISDLISLVNLDIRV